jgi:hypothetical protein
MIKWDNPHISRTSLTIPRNMHRNSLLPCAISDYAQNRSGDSGLFYRDGDAESTSSYHMKLLSIEGLEYYLEGHKLLNPMMAFSVRFRKTWEATTALNINIT